MPYPPAPWTLRGYALQTLQAIDITKASLLVPSELDIVAVLPGKTLGGIYVAHYGDDSTLTYNELIVVAALTRYRGELGAWVSHIYVDNPDSVEGGHEIWGLPKELAQFTWDQNEQNQVSVYQDEKLLCSLSYSWSFNLWRQSLTVNSFSILGTDLLRFQGQTISNLRLVGANLKVPEASPFSQLVASPPLLVVKSTELELIAGVPQPVR